MSVFYMIKMYSLFVSCFTVSVNKPCTPRFAGSIPAGVSGIFY